VWLLAKVGGNVRKDGPSRRHRTSFLLSSCVVMLWGAGCRVPGAGCRVPGAGCRVPGAGCRVPGAGCRVPGAGWYGVRARGGRDGCRGHGGLLGLSYHGPMYRLKQGYGLPVWPQTFPPLNRLGRKGDSWRARESATVGRGGLPL